MKSAVTAAWLDPEKRRFLRFLIVGGINTLFGYGLFAAFIHLGLHYALATALATVCGVLFNFHSTGKIVFDNTDRRRLFRFVGVYTLLWGFNVAGQRVGASLGASPYLSGAVLLAPSAVIGYVLNKRLVFQATS
ncbi:MAG TPA: GtrA family protein [Polyangiales bacterium]